MAKSPLLFLWGEIMIYLLIICIPLMLVISIFGTLKSVQLGLRWQIQTTQHKPPELNMPNPIQPILEAKQEKQAVQQDKQLQNILDEWVNGAEESR